MQPLLRPQKNFAPSIAIKISAYMNKISKFNSSAAEYQQPFIPKLSPEQKKLWINDVSALLKSGISTKRLHKILKQDLFWEPDEMAGNYYGQFRSEEVLKGDGDPVRRHHVHDRAEVAQQLIESQLTPNKAFDLMQKVWRVTAEEHKKNHKGQKVKIKDMAKRS